MKVNYSANNLMVNSPVFVGTKDCMENNLKHLFRRYLNKIKKYEAKTGNLCAKNIFLKDYDMPKKTNSFFKKQIIGENEYTLVAYPDSDLETLLSIMKALKLECIPIVKHPWNRELLRFIKRNEVEKAIKNLGK